MNTVKEVGKSAKDFGVYGRKETFNDAKVTVTEFLDDLYDDRKNYNQSFLSFERRLQEYFGYEQRDTENGKDEEDAGNVDFVVYHDGFELGRYPDEDSAISAVRSYAGEHSVWYEREPKCSREDLKIRKAKAHYMEAIRCLVPDMTADAVEDAEKGFDVFMRDIMVELK